MQYLDIGGGFQDSNFESMAPTIREAVELHIPSDIQVIAEPGRYYARSAYTLVCKVISRRRQIGAEATTPDMLYQNDGVYGNFMNVLVEKEEMRPSLVTPALSNLTAPSREEGEHWYTIWGPTCDSVDCVSNKARLESEVKVGDWLMYKNMGGESPNQLVLSVGIDPCSVYHGDSHQLQRIRWRASDYIHQQRIQDWRPGQDAIWKHRVVYPVRGAIGAAGDSIVFDLVS